MLQSGLSVLQSGLVLLQSRLVVHHRLGNLAQPCHHVERSAAVAIP